jgi:hypothetical protein
MDVRFPGRIVLRPGETGNANPLVEMLNTKSQLVDTEGSSIGQFDPENSVACREVHLA